VSGVVLGPDDRPVAHAAVSYNQQAAWHHTWLRTDSQGHFTISETESRQLRSTGVRKAFFPSGKERQLEVRGQERSDFALDLRKGNSQGLRKNQAKTVNGDSSLVRMAGRIKR